MPAGGSTDDADLRARAVSGFSVSVVDPQDDATSPNAKVETLARSILRSARLNVARQDSNPLSITHVPSSRAGLACDALVRYFIAICDALSLQQPISGEKADWTL